MATEVEAKFRAADAAPLARLAKEARLGGAELGPIETVDETDRYLDTDRGHLAEARWACRLRERNGSVRISLKGPPAALDPGRPWLHRRPEVEGPATPAAEPALWPASTARDLLLRLSRGADLRELLLLRQRRGERPVMLDGRRIGTLSLDHCVVLSRGLRLGELHVVELELADEANPREAALHDLAATLAARPGLEAETLTKYEHALRLLERAR